MTASPVKPDRAPVQPGNLTRQEAAERAALVSDVRYAVTLDLTCGDAEFAAHTTIRFQVSAANRAVFLDYAGWVERVECNGILLGPQAFDGTRIHLPVRDGQNTVEVHGVAPFGRVGAGLHRFCDPEDGHAYLHTKFEPFDAHRVYPCFDQPDLKAVLSLDVVAPTGWRVVANTAPSAEPEQMSAERVRWTFAPTPRLSTYLTALVAGPFHRIASTHHGLPLALYARGSLLDPLTEVADELFDLTRQGLDFYTRLFEQPYPFTKYEQVFVPEYAFGAMEHPGCVTFNEQFVFKSRVTEESLRRRCEVMLHEMAHMWFGNLVTMRWWDDLWLNESFATFMAAMAQEEATRFGEAWVSFTHHACTTARHYDQLPSSHPVAVDAPDTDAVRLNFDPLTYKKGAAVLHQLAAYLGRDAFMSGIRGYLDRHAWGNADLDDFLAALQNASGADLGPWAREWLRSAGVSTVEASPSPDGVRLSQLANPGVAPRRLRLQVGRYDVHETGVELGSRVRLDLAASAAVPATAGAQPGLVIPNDDGASYLKVRLDEESRKAALAGLSALGDPMARAVTWGALWDEVLDARLPAREFVACVFAHGAAESDVGILQSLWERAMRAAVDYGERANVERALGCLGGRARAQLETATPGSDRQLVWARILAGAAQVSDFAVLGELLGGRSPWPGLEVSRDLRWRVLLSLAAGGQAGDEDIATAAETGLGDDSDRLRLTVEAARPCPQAKEEAWRRTFSEDYSLAQRRAAMAGLQQPGQEEVLTPYVDRYFTALETVWPSLGPEMAIAFTRALYPRISFAEQEVLSRTDEVLAQELLPRDLARILRDERAELALSSAARACDAESALDDSRI
jgi:aminopeptidase N